MKNLFAVAALCAFLSSPALADSASQESSALIAIGSSNVVKGSAQILAAGATLSIASVEKSGEFMVLAIKDAAKASEVVLKLPIKTLGEVTLASGQAVEVIAGSAGNLLVVSGKAIALVPNELGKTLVKSTKLD